MGFVRVGGASVLDRIFQGKVTFNAFPLKKYAENMLIVWKYDLNVTDWFLE